MDRFTPRFALALAKNVEEMASLTLSVRTLNLNENYLQGINMSLHLVVASSCGWYCW